MPNFRLPGLVAFLLALALFGLSSHRRIFTAGNDAARWATIESIVDRGTTAIDGSRFASTVDQVRLDGHLYSNKPPALAFAGAAIYALLENAFGWRLDGPGAANVIQVTTVLLVGLPAALLVLLFDGALGRFRHLGPFERATWTAALGAGTLLWPFATTFNAHVPAAALLFAAFLAALDGRARFAAIATGLAALLDLLPGVGLAPCFALILLRTAPSGGVGRFARTLAGPAVAGVLLNLLHHGSWLPLKLVRGAVDLAAQAGPSAGGVVLPSRATYPLEILFGGHGLFLVSPILLVGLVGLVAAARRAPFGETRSWRLLAAGLALQFAGHALLAGSYGGWSYGFRYLLPIQPLLLFAAPWAFSLRSQGAMVRTFLLAFLLPPSVLFSALGAFHPWPPAYEQEGASGPWAEVAAGVRNPVGGNAAAWLAVHRPGTRVARWTEERWVSADPERARRYYQLFYGSKGDLATMRRFAE
ncbi:MAG: hypothetical protein AB7G12_05450 [Thermoanaerobaculia bacterium]